MSAALNFREITVNEKICEPHNDGEPKSASKESSYLDKNKENNSYNDNCSADENENCLKTFKEDKKKWGQNKIYEIFKIFASDADLKSTIF
jgi:hypothetical protein